MENIDKHVSGPSSSTNYPRKIDEKTVGKRRVVIKRTADTQPIPETVQNELKVYTEHVKVYTPKTASERNKLYRARKKLAARQAFKSAEEATSNTSSGLSQDDDVQFLQNRVEICIPPIKSTYEATFAASSILSQHDDFQLISKRVKVYTPKTSSERSKLCRERKKLAALQSSMVKDGKATSRIQDDKIQIQQSSIANYSKPKAKSAAERSKAYRARKKLTAQQSSTKAIHSAVMSDKHKLNEMHQLSSNSQITVQQSPTKDIMPDEIQFSTFAPTPQMEVPVKMEEIHPNMEETMMKNSSVEDIINSSIPILKTEDLSSSPTHNFNTERLSASPIHPSYDMEVSVKDERIPADPENSMIEFSSAENVDNTTILTKKYDLCEQKVQPSALALSSQMELSVKVEEVHDDPEEFAMEYSSVDDSTNTSFVKTELSAQSSSKGTMEEERQQDFSEIDLSRILSESCNSNQKCIFCCKSSKKVGNCWVTLTHCMTSDYFDKLKKMAEMMGDEPFIYRINNSTNLPFHQNCKFKYQKKYESSLKSFKSDRGLWYKTRDIHKKAFEALTKFLSEEIFNKEYVYYFSDIFQIYKALLKEIMVDNFSEHDFENYKPEHLQDEILKNHGNDIVITLNIIINKTKKIVYKTGMNIDKSLFKKLLFETSELSKLRNVAYDLRSSVRDIEINRRNQLEFEDTIKNKCPIPHNLHNFMTYLVKGPEGGQSADDDDERIESLCQNVIHIINKGKSTSQD